MSLCPNCHLGTLRETNTTYLRALGNDLVTVPNVLTWVCDVCGERSYDQDTISRIEALLGPEASFDTDPHPLTRRRPSDSRGRSLRHWT